MKFEDYKAYKYVRLDTGELRFCMAGMGGASHKSLANGEKAISAGLIGIFPDEFTMIDSGSMTLGLFDNKDSDIPLLEKATGRKFR